MDGPPNILNFDLAPPPVDETGVAPANPPVAEINFVDLLNIAVPPTRPVASPYTPFALVDANANLAVGPASPAIPRTDSHSGVRPVTSAPVVVPGPGDPLQTITSATTGQDSRLGLTSYPITDRTSRGKVPMSERIVARVAEVSQVIHLVDLWYTICHTRNVTEVIKSPTYLKLESLKETILIPLKEELADLYSKSKLPRVVAPEPVISLRDDIAPFTPSNSPLFSNPDPLALFDRTEFTDGRGGWTVFFKLTKHSLKKLVPLTHLLVFSETAFKFLTDSTPLWNDLEHLLEMLRLMKRITFLHVTPEEIEGLSMTIKIPPFWYQCGQGLSPLKELIETVKVNIFSLTEESDSVSSTLFRTGTAFLSHVGKVLTSGDNSESLVELHRKATIVQLKSFYDLPDHPLCKPITGMLQIPPIITSKKIYVPRAAEAGGPVPALLIYYTNVPNHEALFPLTPQGMSLSKTNPKPPPKPAKWEVDVILHFHGGGFVAGSPSFHESYTREWAQATRALIISVDYTLSPKAIFPTALGECYHVYQWLCDPNNELGVVPKHIIVTGDSAGGNLTLTTCLRAIVDKIRIPDALLAFYPAGNLTRSVVNSPSRVMFFHDVFVPIHFMYLCLDSYVPKASGVDPSNFLVSPVFAPEWVLKQLPPHLYFFSAAYDPLLDDTTNFIRRLDKYNIPYQSRLYYLPHGFLNFCNPFVPEALRAKNDATCVLLNILVKYRKPAPAPPK